MVKVRLNAYIVLFSFCSIGYELLIAKTLSELTDNILFWESCSIGVYILGLGIGTLLYPYMKSSQDKQLLFNIEIILSGLGGVLVPLILLVHGFYRIYLLDHQVTGLRPFEIIMLSLQSLTFLVGVLSGIEGAILLSWHNRSEKSETFFARYFFYYECGSLLSCLFFSAYLLWQQRIIVGCFFAMVNLSLACFLLFFADIVVKRRHYFIMISTLLFISIIGAFAENIESLHLKNYYYNRMTVTSSRQETQSHGPVDFIRLYDFLREFPQVIEILSPYQKIHLVPEEFDAYFRKENRLQKESSEWELYLNHHFQFSTRNENIYHEYMAHIPIMMSDRLPQEVLVLGAGDGLLARELLRYPQVHVTLVELDANITALAQSSWLKEKNQGALTHDRLTLHHADAFHWLRTHHQRFDGIYLDFPTPYSWEVLRLYSLEFYQLVRKNLSPGGYVAMDVPIRFDQPHSRQNQVIIHTLTAAGFSQMVAYKPQYETFLLATVQSGSLSLRYRNVGLNLATIYPEWFEMRGNIMVFPMVSDPSYINSIWKPLQLGYKDPSF